MTLRNQHSVSARNSKIRTLNMGLDRTGSSVFCVYLLLLIYTADIFIYSVPFILILLITFLVYQPMYNVCSLHTFVVFLLHVSALHSPSSGRNFFAFIQAIYFYIAISYRFNSSYIVNF